MAPSSDTNVENVEGKLEQQPDVGEGARQAKALDSLTDHVEEKQLNEEKTKEAMQALSGNKVKADKIKQERENELAKVKILSEHVDIIAEEFEVRESSICHFVKQKVYCRSLHSHS